MTTGRVYLYLEKHYTNLTDTKTKQTETFLKGKLERTLHVCNIRNRKIKAKREGVTEGSRNRELRNGRKETLSGSRRTEWNR